MDRAIDNIKTIVENICMSHARSANKERVVNLRKAYGLSGFGEVKARQTNEGGKWLPKSGGAMRSKKDKMSDRQHQRKAIYDMTGVWVK